MKNDLLNMIGGELGTLLVSPESAEHVMSCLNLMAVAPQFGEIMQSAQTASYGDDYWPAAGTWEASLKPYVVKQGVLQIPVKGVLLNNFPYAFGGYATGYKYIQKAMERGLADDEVKGIALVCDSPGGMVAGCFELADKIYDARKQKSIEAFAHESAYSAAYAIASAAKKITVSKTGGVGSIGVVTMHVDQSKALENAGLTVTFIYKGKHKIDGNSYKPLSKDAFQRIEARIEETYGVFCDAVDRNRGLKAGTASATEALTFSASVAVTEKLADKVGPLDEALVEYSNCLSHPEDDDEMESHMAITAEEKAAHEAAVAQARKDGETAARGAEKARITAILGSEAAKKRPAAAQVFAMDTDMSAEAAEAALAKLPEEAAPKATTNGGSDSFAAHMAATHKETPGAEHKDGTEAKELTAAEKSEARVARIKAAKFGPEVAAK